MHLFLYGPPGSGKTTIGSMLAKRLELPFIDLDDLIVANAGITIPEIFATYGETNFREREAEALKSTIMESPSIISLGGGALLRPENRKLAEEHGKVLCFQADATTLEARVARTPGSRPLLNNAREAEAATPTQAPKPKPLAQLLAERHDHYASFQHQVTVSERPPEETTNAVQAALGRYRITGMGQSYNVHVAANLLDHAGLLFAENNLGTRTVIVGDNHTLPLYGARLAASLRRQGITVNSVQIPAGEDHKTIATINTIWSAFLAAGIERGDTVIALGGGVVGDLTGFAAATWLRGVRWVGIPTTMLAMVDSSLGGKTGADLPEGKNLIGAFHPPSLVLADTALLASLPARELRGGLAEVVKHAIIDDPTLLDSINLFNPAANAPNSEPCHWLNNAEWLAPFVARAMGVKINIIQQDPFEKGRRAALNLGHTIGHGIEHATGFSVSHGEAVAIGTVLEARLAEELKLASSGLAAELASIFSSLGLPTAMPRNIDLQAVQQAITLDKKKAGGIVRYALPAAIGDVRTGIVVDTPLLQQILHHIFIIAISIAIAIGIGIETSQCGRDECHLVHKACVNTGGSTEY